MNFQKIKLASCILTPLALAACGGGGSSVTDERCQVVSSGEETSNCSTDIVQLETSSILRAKKSLAAGEKLVLNHQLDSALVDAQFIHNGSLYDLNEFTNLHTAENSSSNEAIGYQSNTPWYNTYLEDNSLSIYQSGDNFEYLLSFEDNDQNHKEVQSFSVDSNGLATGHMTLATISGSNRVLSQKLISNNYLITTIQNSTTLNLQIVDSEGTVLAGPTDITTEGADGTYEATRVAQNSTGDIILCHAETAATANPSEYTTTLNLKRLDASLTEQASVQLTSGLVSGSEYLDCHLQLLPDGQLAALYEKPDQRFNPALHFALINEDLSTKSTTAISDTYLAQNSISQSSNGNILIALELGGPDAAVYTVFNDQGVQIKPATMLSKNEPEDFASYGFSDGSFALIFTEDDSIAATLKIIDNKGDLLPEESILTPFHTIGYGKMLTHGTGNSDSFKLIYEGYEQPLGVIEVFKNRLILEDSGDTQVTLSNQSQHEVEVLITVTGAAQED